MKALHVLNSALWLVNAVVWAFYAGVFLMAAVSLGATLLSAAMWRYAE